nr:hypothetical protein [uncultured Massilia sp.]
MYGKVKRLRERGRRMNDREIAQAPFVEGELKLVGLAMSYILEVTDPTSQVGQSLFPTLYDARLVTMHGDGMLFKGEERPQGEGGPAYVQEWSVRLGSA